MPQAFRSNGGQVAQGQGARPPTMQFTNLALRSLGQVYDFNLSAARLVLRTQSRAASMLGLPDWSGLFDAADERARRLFTTGAEQWVNNSRRASEAAAELQREIGRAVDTETATIAQTLQEGMEQLGQQVSEGFNQLVQTTRAEVEEVERAAAAANQDTREAMQNGEQSGEQQAAGEEREKPRRRSA